MVKKEERYLFNDIPFSKKDENILTVKALVDISKTFKPNKENKITICFEDGKISSSKIGTDSNLFGAPCTILTKERCKEPSMKLRWTDPPTEDFEFNGEVFPLEQFKNEFRTGCSINNIGNIICDPEVSTGQVILHEFMHALGAQHEHANPSDRPFTINKEAVYKDYCDAPGANQETCKDEADFQVISHFTCGRTQEGECTSLTAFDPDSIMMYNLPDSYIASGENTTKLNYKLSNGDKFWLGQEYPLNAIEKPVVNVVFSNGKDWQKAFVEKKIKEDIEPFAGIDFNFKSDSSAAICGSNTSSKEDPLRLILILILISIAGAIGLIILVNIILFVIRKLT